ncbi:MAG: glycosyltransferase [Bdellovibrionaceae bacterium]|nr:glycosyltransferase [Pseudobdellovibrionaceae bacterium]|tara:strand:- start:24031 stop:24975 length:945 start_codon:yes stop_codon:yes gene_type:complete
MNSNSTEKPHISIVSPIYGDPVDIEELYRQLVQHLSPITSNFEIILVNDRSPDNSWSKIQKISQSDPRVRGVLLSRNFGQHYAISAGLEYVTGDWCVVMDCDLQDRPEEIPRLYELATDQDYDSLVARRIARQDSILTRWTSWFFYIVFNYLTDQKYDNREANFGIYKLKVIDAIRQYTQKDRSFGLMVSSVGFKKGFLEVKHGERSTGTSSYTFTKRLGLAIDLILSNSIKPLRLTVQLGFVISALSLTYSAYVIWMYFNHDQMVSGWTSTIVSMFFLFGILISIMGMVGLYVGKTYNQVMGRPLYIVDKTTF